MTEYEALVEKVAEDIDPQWFPVREIVAFTYPKLVEKYREKARARARAAIATIYAAMREPSEEMQTAADTVIFNDLGEEGYTLFSSDVISASITAAIDASPLNPEARNAD